MHGKEIRLRCVVKPRRTRWPAFWNINYLNDPPVADPDLDQPDDGYFIAVGAVLALDGTASRDPNEPSGDAIAGYEWDLNMDGVFETLGPKPVIAPAVLQALGLGAGDGKIDRRAPKVALKFPGNEV